MNLDFLESKTQQLIANARRKAIERQSEKRRNSLIQERAKGIRDKILSLITTINVQLEDAEIFEPGEAEFVELTAHREQLQSTLEDAIQIATAEIDAELIQEEEDALSEIEAQDLYQWRQGLKHDLLDTIAEQNTFYLATDAALMVKANLDHLKAIDAVDEVVLAVVNRINFYDSKKEQRNNLPCVEIKDGAEATLFYICNKALEFRSTGNPNITPVVKRRTIESPPSAHAQYDDLVGKVVVFGGHDRLEEKVRRRLSHSKIQLMWSTAQDGVAKASRLADQVYGADLVVLITGYCNHTISAQLKKAIEGTDIMPVMISTTGMDSFIKLIAEHLKIKQLQSFVGTSPNGIRLSQQRK